MVSTSYCSWKGQFEIMQIVVKFTSKKDSLTPLLLAAGKGHFQVCTFIMENLENKNTWNKRGKTPFHVNAKRGQLRICRLKKYWQ